jgi:hypothetical protein
MSTIFRTKEWMTVAQLVRAWARELAAPEYGDPQHFERDLLHTLMEDAVNGRLDNSGPFREGQRSGLMIITPENKAGFIEGHQLRDLVPVGPANRWLLDRVVVMREAVLDFAKRRQLCPPSWWSASTPTTGSPTDACNAIPITKVKRRSFGKTPRIRDYLIQHYPDGVPDPAHCPRKALKNVLIEWDHRLSPLDDGTLKKAIDVHNANLSKPQL